MHRFLYTYIPRVRKMMSYKKLRAGHKSRIDENVVTLFLFFIGITLLTQSRLMLSSDMLQDGEDTKPI